MKCVICGGEIIEKKSLAKYCSEECVRIARNERTKKYIRMKKSGNTIEPAKEPRNCKICGTEFIPNQPKQTYCCRSCYKEAARKRNAENWKTNHPTKGCKPRECVVCGKIFTPENIRQLSCSDKCATARAYQKARESNKRLLEEREKQVVDTEPTVEKCCPKDCVFYSHRASLTSCDYILITGTCRPCGIGKDCTTYTNVGKKTKKNPVITYSNPEEAEIEAYRMDLINRQIGREYRRGNIVSRRGKSRK